MAVRMLNILTPMENLTNATEANHAGTQRLHPEGIEQNIWIEKPSGTGGASQALGRSGGPAPQPACWLNLCNLSTQAVLTNT